MDRTDVFEGTGPTPGSYIRIKMGADAQGKITAAEAYLAYESGGFPGSPIGAGCICVLSCYDIPAARVEGYDVCVNKPRTSAYRAPGSTNAAFAIETVVTEIAEKLKQDPLQFRLNNVAVEGTRRVDGLVYPRIGLKECLEAIQKSDHWKTPLSTVPRPACATLPHELHHTNGLATHKKFPRGRGVASGYWMNVGFQSSVTLSLNGDGKVTLIEGSTDIGGTRTSIAMQLAETLGIPVEDICPLVADTDGVGYTDVTGGSRVTHTTGWAAHKAGLALQDLLCNRAAKIWDVDPGLVKYDANHATIVGPPKAGKPQQLTFKEIAAQLFATGEPITTTANVSAPTCGGSFGTHVVDIEVDPDTAKVTVLRYTAAQDAGTAIHPAYVEGQMQGGVAQGIGWALNEEYFYDDKGTMRNSTYLDYRVPTCFDLPNIETLIVEVPNPDHPYGVRGVGEVPICPPPAAIAAAIYNAVGVRMLQLPMSPPRLLKEILGKRP